MMSTNKEQQMMSAILLAGGEAKRLDGADKGLLLIEGMPLIAIIIQQLQPVIDDIVISSNHNREQYLLHADSVITDAPPYEFAGPLAGIWSCLASCQHEQVLVTCCDIPLLPQDLVTRLQHALDKHDVAVATIDDHKQAVLLVRKHCRDSIQQFLADDNRSLLQWIEQQDYVSVDFECQPPVFSNINTRDDLDKLQAHFNELNNSQ